MLAGIGTAWYLYVKSPALPAKIRKAFGPVYDILDNKYGFDAFNEKVIAAGTRGLGNLFSKIGDALLIDGIMVNGSAKTVDWFAGVIRHIQSGYLYHYAFAMIIGLIGFLLITVY